MSCRRVALGFLVLLSIIVASIDQSAGQQVCPSARFASQATPAPPREVVGTDLVHVTVNGTRYAVPRNYFDYPPERAWGCDTVQESFSVRAFLSDFSGATSNTLNEFNHVGGGWGRVVPIQVRSIIQVRSADHTPDLGGFVGLWANRRPVNWSDNKAYGLQTGSYRDATWKWDVFVGREHDTVTHVMKCTSPESVPYPSCHAVLFLRDDQVEFYFDRKRITEWREIRDGVVKLLEQFIRDGAIT